VLHPARRRARQPLLPEPHQMRLPLHAMHGRAPQHHQRPMAQLPSRFSEATAHEARPRSPPMGQLTEPTRTGVARSLAPRQMQQRFCHHQAKRTPVWTPPLPPPLLQPPVRTLRRLVTAKVCATHDATLQGARQGLVPQPPLHRPLSARARASHGRDVSARWMAEGGWVWVGMSRLLAKADARGVDGKNNIGMLSNQTNVCAHGGMLQISVKSASEFAAYAPSLAPASLA
jgi:hypothetical protein